MAPWGTLIQLVLNLLSFPRKLSRAKTAAAEANFATNIFSGQIVHKGKVQGAQVPLTLERDTFFARLGNPSTCIPCP